MGESRNNIILCFFFFYDVLLELAGLYMVYRGVTVATAQDAASQAARVWLTTPAIALAVAGACTFLVAFYSYWGIVRDCLCILNRSQLAASKLEDSARICKEKSQSERTKAKKALQEGNTDVAKDHARNSVVQNNNAANNVRLRDIVEDTNSIRTVLARQKYLGMMLCLLLMLVLATVLSYIYGSSVDFPIDQHLRQTEDSSSSKLFLLEHNFDHYNTNATCMQWVDHFQKEIHCCGSTSPSIPWNTLAIPLPASCYPSNANEGPYTEACIFKLAGYVRHLLFSFAQIAFSVAAFLVFGIIITICLVCFQCFKPKGYDLERLL